MSRIEFQVQGSSEDPYRVVFEKNGSNLNAFCTCPAGANGQYCKHRFRILSGNSENIVSSNADRVVELVDWLVGTDVEEMLRELAHAEDECARTAKVVKEAKRRLAASMRS